MREVKQDFPLWSGVVCPEWFERFREDFPDPKTRIYYNSNLYGPNFSMGFDLEKGDHWNRRGVLIDFLYAADEKDWIVNENFGFPKES